MAAETELELEIKKKLTDQLEPTHIELKDISGGCGKSFEVLIVSEKFKDKPLLERHRLVNGILSEEIKLLHAFSQKTYTPEQWHKMNN
ncbi:PREDICTED: uncharacterized bolA-like protein C8C9.11 [Amphimedon queenslandica]|uniref:BolA n=1 Tax=Amphimedon queenslandica TaxID=400682 RepID=A0A1X7V1J5_AMPQE|nr:PREDICTED: uncharacterized bolA-like protein C8C9.11 [Amphimedon queenslandica]|eukprot:XP_019851165.1 PREDICTED: uncharacterized bolA-like protein C8C9.11 [Amphimedon queenslandica]